MAYLGFVPSGVLLSFAGATAPQGWVLCDGSAISRTVYASLFAAISTTYGVGDGSTTFNLPDMRGVFARGSGTNGTGNYGGVTGHTPAGGSLGNKGGQKTAKNGLSNSSSSVTGSTDNGTLVGYNNATANAFQGVASYVQNVNPTSTNTVHTHSVSGTAAAQTITGDSETTPAFLAVNYIIKI